MKFFKNKKGFTLVELVVVIAILGILAGIAIPRFMDATATARGAKIVADMRTIDSAIMMYTAQTGADIGSKTAAEAKTALVDGTTQYMSSWPTPPDSTAKVDVKGTLTTITAPTTNVYTITSGRASYGSYTSVDKILNP